MSVVIGKYERLEAPEDFNAELAIRFGVNVYGGPAFRVIWGQTDTIRVSKASGGYEDYPRGGNVAAWLLQKWSPPEKWGTRTVFNIMNYDHENGQLLREFPELGEYETIAQLPRLDFAVIDWLVPSLTKVLALSAAQIKAAKEWAKEQQNRQEVDEITDRLMDALPTRYGPTSYGRGGCRTSILDQKMSEIQKVWTRNEKQIRAGKLLPKGMSQVG